MSLNCEHCGKRNRVPTQHKYCSQSCYVAHKWGDVHTRILDRVTILSSDECWPWTGVKDKNGYGMFSNYRFQGKKEQRSNRIIWTMYRGEIRQGLFVLHKCDNPSCCNPKHLFLGTAMDNMRDKCQKGRYKCPVGDESPHSKLTTNTVLEIRRLFQHGISQREIARRFQTGFKNVHKIVHRQRWKHV